MLEYLQPTSPLPKHLFFYFFSCCAELSKSVLVHRTALSHWRPSTTNVPQRAEERPPLLRLHPPSVSSSSSGELERCRFWCWCWCHPIGILATAIWALASPGDQDSRTCFFTPGGLAGQLELCCYSQSATPSPAANPPCLPSTLRNAGPASRIFLHELRVGCLLLVANQLAA